MNTNTLVASDSSNTEKTFPAAFKSFEDYQAFRAKWRAYANEKPASLTAEDMALFAAAMGRPLGKAFSPITNTTKLSHGHRPWAGALEAIGNMNGRLSCYAKNPTDLTMHLDLYDVGVALSRATETTLAAERGTSAA